MPVCTIIVFFFSSRRRHTRLTCDWSSDVCSSDLPGYIWERLRPSAVWSSIRPSSDECSARGPNGMAERAASRAGRQHRSEERRVGKEWRGRGWADHKKKKIEGDAVGVGDEVAESG